MEAVLEKFVKYPNGILCCYEGLRGETAAKICLCSVGDVEQRRSAFGIRRTVEAHLEKLQPPSLALEARMKA